MTLKIKLYISFIMLFKFKIRAVSECYLIKQICSLFTNEIEFDFVYRKRKITQIAT